MFVDEITIHAKAGDGGNGVVRWRHEKFKPLAGPSGGDGGNGGDIYLKAVKDLNRLAKYTGNKSFSSNNGDGGANQSQAGKNGDDLYIEIPVGSRVTDIKKNLTFEFLSVGETKLILRGGRGGFGNEHFKSATDQAPTKAVRGTKGESGEFIIEVALTVDVGLIGLPNAGKSTILNNLTNARSKVGSYPFTTLEPHLGELHGFIVADIPGLIKGASTGKGLGHKFLKHVSRTKMLLHVVSLSEIDPISAYYTIREELTQYDKSLSDKEEWIILSKNDLVDKGFSDNVVLDLAKIKNRVLVVSEKEPETYKKLGDTLVSHLREKYNS